MRLTCVDYFSQSWRITGDAPRWLAAFGNVYIGAIPQFKEDSMSSKQSQPPTVQTMIGDFAPKLVELTDNVLFADIWERAGLAKRDRSLITVAALIALNRTEQLPFHLNKALDNGLTKDELIEVITQLAFYAGWPNAMSAVMIAKNVFAVKE
jgi:4-carboxymuconolactone decarboxylase